MKISESLVNAVQPIRDLQRPYLTCLFATAYVIGVLGIMFAIIYAFIVSPVENKQFPFKDVVAIMGLLGGPFASMQTYHFMKNAKKDSSQGVS